jgi:hypothetical protein
MPTRCLTKFQTGCSHIVFHILRFSWLKDKELKLSCLVDHLKYWLANIWTYIMPSILVGIKLYHSIKLFLVYCLTHFNLTLIIERFPFSVSSFLMIYATREEENKYFNSYWFHSPTYCFLFCMCHTIHYLK